MSICASVESKPNLTALLEKLKEFTTLSKSGRNVQPKIRLSSVFPSMTIELVDDLTGQRKTLHLKDCMVRLNESNSTIRVLCEETRIGINLNLRDGRACFAQEDRERLFAPASLGVAG